MSKKKRHHYIPRFYLEGFVDPNNKPYIWVYEKGNPNIIKATAENIAVKKHYYSFTVEGSKDSESFENFFAEIEARVAPLFRKIKNHEKLNKQEKSVFSFFIASIRTRVLSYREKNEKEIADVVKRLGKVVAARLEGIESMKKCFEEGNYDINVNPNFSLALEFKLTEQLAPIFYKMKWVFFIATDDYKFVTSDNPLCYYDPTHDPQTFYGVGLANKNIEVTFPLSKDLVLLGSWTIKKEGYVKANNNIVREITRRTVISASRFVFASSKSEALNRLVQKYKGSAPKMTVR